MLGGMRGMLNSGNFRGSGAMLGAMGGSAFGMQAASAALRGVTTAYSTPIDAQINQQLSPAMRGMMGYRHGLPVVGPLFEAFDAWRTSDAREGAAASQRRLQSQMVNGERARSRAMMINAGAASRAELASAGGRDLFSTHIGARAGIMAAGERASSMMADLRFEGINRRFGDEMDAAIRGQGLGGGALAEMRSEIGRRSNFGAAERFRIEEERRAAQSDLTRASAPISGADPGGVRESDRLRQVEEARRRILDLERQDVDLTRQAGEHETQRLERIRQFFQQAEQGYQRIAEHERTRIQNFREQFGLMDEISRMEIQQLARRASAQGGAGIQGLSADELGRLRETGLFDEQIRGEATRRGNLAGAQAIIRASGAQGRQEAAEARAREAGNLAASVSNEINVTLNVTAADVARQINERVEPLIQQLLIATTARLEQQIERQIEEAGRQVSLQNGQGQQQ
jgi:hypothetical protein